MELYELLVIHELTYNDVDTECSTSIYMNYSYYLNYIHGR